MNLSQEIQEALADAISVVEAYRKDFAHHGCGASASADRCSYCPVVPLGNDTRCRRCRDADAILDRLRALSEGAA